MIQVHRVGFVCRRDRGRTDGCELQAGQRECSLRASAHREHGQGDGCSTIPVRRGLRCSLQQRERDLRTGYAADCAGGLDCQATDGDAAQDTVTIESTTSCGSVTCASARIVTVPVDDAVSEGSVAFEFAPVVMVTDREGSVM